jgi:predicted nucleic acid-binding Zn ribbon protein
MAITDVIGGARPIVCQWCGAPFLTKAYKPRYCSDRCKETAHTRRGRDKEKKKAE